MESLRSVRIDKWLWAVRLYKTRALAIAACKARHVAINGANVKPAREVRAGELITSRHGEITRTTKVLGLIERRVGASAATTFAEDLTPASEHAKRTAPDLSPVSHRPKGAGRPTKKERRDLQEFFGRE